MIRLYLVPVGKVGDEGYICGNDVAGVRGSVVRKWLVAPESRMFHHLMVAVSVDIVLR